MTNTRNISFINIVNIQELLPILDYSLRTIAADHPELDIDDIYIRDAFTNAIIGRAITRLLEMEDYRIVYLGKIRYIEEEYNTAIEKAVSTLMHTSLFSVLGATIVENIINSATYAFNIMVAGDMLVLYKVPMKL